MVVEAATKIHLQGHIRFDCLVTENMQQARNSKTTKGKGVQEYEAVREVGTEEKTKTDLSEDRLTVAERRSATCYLVAYM